MLNTLSYIGENLNESNILWGVGASMLLSQYHLINQPNDIDLFVDIKDIEKADGILLGLGRKKPREKTAAYATEYFYEYTIHGFDVDVMAGFKINHDCGIFEYIFDHHSIAEVVNINGVDIPFTSLEDWYVMYQLIPDREKKVNLIEAYLMANGIGKPALLKRALQGNLPPMVRKKIMDLLCGLKG